jgi:hypothetical protein
MMAMQVLRRACVSSSRTALPPMTTNMMAIAPASNFLTAVLNMPPHARFSSKRRVRYGDSESSSRGKLFSFMKQKQKAQLDKLRASLASEQIAKMSVPPSSEEEGDTVMADDDASESGNNTGKSAKEFSRMRKLKEAKQERVKHLPLFKPNSPLLRHFGDQTLGDYDQLPTTAFHGQVLVIHSPQEEAIYASYLRAQKVW